jgi:3-hydroxyacyl-[acyl-carrier-protein] dehydratase
MDNSTEKISLNIKEIQEIIPHRYPFLFVDKIEELEPGKRAVGYKNITMNEYFFQGHFPEEPVLPGVIMIEALAQVGAVALLSMDEFKGKIAYFGGINKAKFRRKVIPGDILKLEVEIIKRKGPAGIGKAIATVNGEKAVSAELTFAVGVE